MHKLLNKINFVQLNRKGQSSFEILFVTIMIVLLAGTLYYFTFGNTKDIAEMGIIKTEIETYFIENDMLLTIKDIEIFDLDSNIGVDIKLSKQKYFSIEQISDLEQRIENKIKKGVTLKFN